MTNIKDMKFSKFTLVSIIDHTKLSWDYKFLVSFIFDKVVVNNLPLKDSSFDILIIMAGVTSGLKQLGYTIDKEDEEIIFSKMRDMLIPAYESLTKL